MATIDADYYMAQRKRLLGEVRNYEKIESEARDAKAEKQANADHMLELAQKSCRHEGRRAIKIDKASGKEHAKCLICGLIL
jgi:L-lactate utilization protein LutB